MTDTWGYVRLSGRSGNSPDAGLDEQKRSIREYCRTHDLTLQTTRNDGEKTSGFDEDRDEYQLLREKISSGGIDAVVTRDRARLSRRFDERLWLIATMREQSVEWHVTEEGRPLNLDDVQSAMFECIHAGMDHIKKKVEMERSRKAMEARKERGCYNGQPPFGLQFAEDKCHLVKSDEWETVEEILEMNRKGRSLVAISDACGVSRSVARRVVKKGLGGYKQLLDEYGLED